MKWICMYEILIIDYITVLRYCMTVNLLTICIEVQLSLHLKIKIRLHHVIIFSVSWVGVIGYQSVHRHNVYRKSPSYLTWVHFDQLINYMKYMCDIWSIEPACTTVKDITNAPHNSPPYAVDSVSVSLCVHESSDSPQCQRLCTLMVRPTNGIYTDGAVSIAATRITVTRVLSHHIQSHTHKSEMLRDKQLHTSPITNHISNFRDTFQLSLASHNVVGVMGCSRGWVGT